MTSSDVVALGLAFSRDRPLQLDGALRSLDRHCRDVERLRLTVLYRATTRAQRSAYRALAREHASRPWLMLLAESDFERDVKAVLRDAPPEAVVLLVVDDALVVRPFELGTASRLLAADPALLAVSLRLGRNTTFTHPLGRAVAAPPLGSIEGDGDDEVLSAEWVAAEGDFGYPFDLSCSVYRAGDLVGAVDRLSFDSPNVLEHLLWERRDAFAADAPRLALFARARGLSVPLNRIQSVSPNPTSGHSRHGPSALLGAYRRGWRVDVRAYDGLSPPTCHFEAELLLRRREETE
jgi:hypothetical protein